MSNEKAGRDTTGGQFGRLVKKLEDAMGDEELPSVLAVGQIPPEAQTGTCAHGVTLASPCMTCITLGDKDPRGPDHGRRRPADPQTDAERGRAFIGEPGERQAQPSRVIAGTVPPALVFTATEARAMGVPAPVSASALPGEGELPAAQERDLRDIGLSPLTRAVKQFWSVIDAAREHQNVMSETDALGRVVDAAIAEGRRSASATDAAPITHAAKDDHIARLRQWGRDLNLGLHDWKKRALTAEEKLATGSASPDALRVAFERGRAVQAKISEADSVKYWRERAEVAEAAEPCTGPASPGETWAKGFRAGEDQAAETLGEAGHYDAAKLLRASFAKQRAQDTPCAGVAEAAQEVVSEIVRENLPKPAVQTAIAKTPCVHGYTWLCPHGCMPDLTSAPNSWPGLREIAERFITENKLPKLWTSGVVELLTEAWNAAIEEAAFTAEGCSASGPEVRHIIARRIRTSALTKGPAT